MINDNYIQIGPNQLIEAGTKQKIKKEDLYEIIDAKENFTDDSNLLQTKMR